MNEPKSTRYQRLKRRATLIEMGGGMACLAAAAFTPISPWWLAGIALAGEAVLHRRDLVIRIGLAAAAGGVVVLAMAVAGRWWWLAAGAGFAAGGAVAGRLLPVLLHRFGGARPLQRRSLMAGLREIARRAGVEVSDILEWRAGNDGRPMALVTGLGNRCRVFVAEEMARDWSDDEVAVVIAHELAHHVHADLWRTLALNAGLLSAAFWAAEVVRAVRGPADLSIQAAPAALPLVAFVAGSLWLAATPVRFAQSRAHERNADRFALRLTGEAGPFGSAVRRLSAQHLAEERPASWVRWFFHRHPPVAERLAMAKTFNEAMRQ